MAIPYSGRHATRARDSLGGYCYHVLNRGNARRTVFHKDGDYDAFVRLLREAGERVDVRLLAFCLLRNHFHLLLWPRHDGDLSAYMMWLTTAHVRRYHQHYHSSGRVWQGRFRSLPIQEDEHLLTVHRYIERNPVRAGLVKRAQDWRWSSAAPVREELPVLTPGPVPHLLDWLSYVNEPQTEAEVESLRECIRRRRPYGDELWTGKTARRMDLEASLHPRGRPPKKNAAAGTFLKESAIPHRAQRAQWTDAACEDVVNRGKNCAASGSGRVVLITYIDDDHCERNWRSLAVDQSGQLAAFQSLGEGALPRGVRQSLEDAEAIDEFIDKVNQA